MQKIVLFIDPSFDPFDKPFNIGHLFMNRIAVDEDAAFEILKICELAPSSWNISFANDNLSAQGRQSERFPRFDEYVKLKGKDLIIELTVKFVQGL